MSVLRLALLFTLAALAVAPAAGARTLVSYERTGGFAGVRDSLVVDTEGRAKAVSGRGAQQRFKLSERELRGLKRALREARFSSLERRYAPEGAVADGYTHSVTHRGKRVIVETGSDPPARLERLLRRLSGILRRR